MRWRATLTVLLLGSGLAACDGGGDGGGDTPAAKPTSDIPKTAWWKEGAGQTGKAAGEQEVLTKPMLASWESLPAPSAGDLQFGADMFVDKTCVSCHSIGKGQVVGPDLQGITRRAEADWVRRFISAPDEMLKSDPRARELLGKYAVAMPNLNLTDKEVTALMQYLKEQDQQAAKAE